MPNMRALVSDRHLRARLGWRMRAEWGERMSLAVLPLLLLGKATDDHGLCLGFADALVSRLGNLQGVDVLPASAVLNVPPGPRLRRPLRGWASVLSFMRHSNVERRIASFGGNV